MIKQIIVVIFILSLIGLTIAIFVDLTNDYELQNPINRAIYKVITGEQISPADHIKEDQIRVEGDKVIITIENANLARFADTNSMDPLLDETSNAIQIAPTSPEDILVGDIISYDSRRGDIIIHRVVNIGEDEEGIFYITKGDNVSRPDDEKVRFWQIRFITGGIIY
jgi:hypothetical protein